MKVFYNFLISVGFIGRWSRVGILPRTTEPTRTTRK